MRILSDANRGRAGFTLIELLAVIAIIGILASIVVPNVARYIARAKVAKAVSEIHNLDTAIAGMLSDTGRSNFRDFLIDGARNAIDTIYAPGVLNNSFTEIQAAQEFYNAFFYNIIRQGRDADFSEPIFAGIDPLDPAVRGKLGTSYMDLGTDSWGNQYNFWMGPLRRGPMLFRSYRVREGVDINDPNFGDVLEDFYIYDAATRNSEQEKLPGQPKPDEGTITAAYPLMHAYGYPAPKDLPVYIWSNGENLEVDAYLLQLDPDFPEFYGGGDDPNNWDNASGWEDAPR